MDLGRWPQEIVEVKPIEEIVAKTNTYGENGGVERKARPQKEEALNCPRCHSTNTKFCYYNNYSLTQPRYFCKACRRYWTQGGSLRNIPVGGGSRKNKRSSSCSNSCSKKLSDPSLSHMNNSSHTLDLEGQDLSLGFPNMRERDQVNENTNNNNLRASSWTSSSCELSAMELLTGSSSNSWFPPIHQDGAATLHTAGLSFPFQDLSAPAHNSTSTGFWTAVLGASGGSNC